MKDRRILIVDDEKNIRLTMSYTLEPLGCQVETAVNGEEALQQLSHHDYDLLLLDLQLPSIDGMDVLRHVAQNHPQTRVAIITAYGTIENAVEAMKLGAIDFIQKPFTPEELRQLVTDIMEREALVAGDQLTYEGHLKLAKRLASSRDFAAAREQAKEAIGIDPARPEAFNLLGALHELSGDRLEAQKNYRVALDLDPTYAPARENLSRSTDSARRFDKPHL